MRNYICIVFLTITICSYSQKVTLTPLSFSKTFELKKAPTSNVLKDYTEFTVSPVKNIPKGFTLSNASAFYKFDTLNCSLFIKKREDVDGLVYYRDCEDGRWCKEKYDLEYWSDVSNNQTESIQNNYHKWKKGLGSCCFQKTECDTSNLILNNEFVSYSAFLDLDKNLPGSLVSQSYVSNKEYDEFRNFVLDSTLRYKIASEYPEKFPFLESQNFWKKRLDYTIKYSLSEFDINLVTAEFYYPAHEMFKNKKEWDCRKIGYQRIEFERFNRLNGTCSFCNQPMYNDECKKGIKDCKDVSAQFSFSDILVYANFLSDRKNPETGEQKLLNNLANRGHYINIQPDTLIWVYNSKESNFNYSIHGSKTYSVNKQNENLPVCGVNRWQADAFLEWKTIQHNKKLAASKQKYRVLYTFPLPEETNEITKPKLIIPKVNFEKYVITNSEYLQFVTYVVDSIVTCMKIENANSNSQNFILNKLTIKRYDQYGDELHESEWNHNTKYYSKHYLKTKEALQKDSLFETYADLFIPEYEWSYYNYSGFDTRKIFYRYQWIFYNADSMFQNRDMDFSDATKNYHTYGYADRSDFIIRERINIFPGYNAREMNRLDFGYYYNQLKELQKKYPNWNDFKPYADTLDPDSYDFKGPMRFEEDTFSEIKLKLYDFSKNPDLQITAITYEQAKAYYHWKNEVPYIPTKEEWEQIKQGINPYSETELEVPGPFFRYVIRVYPVRE